MVGDEDQKKVEATKQVYVVLCKNNDKIENLRI